MSCISSLRDVLNSAFRTFPRLHGGEGRLQADVSDPRERRPISIDHLGFPRMIETDHPKIAREVADEYSPTLPV